MLNDPSDETNWGTQPTDIKSPVLAKRVNRLGTWLENLELNLRSLA